MENPPAPRRVRVAVACDLCRKRKMKCDGARPFCSYCSKRRLNCVYQQPQQRVQVTQAYLTRLLSRVDDLRRVNGRDGVLSTPAGLDEEMDSPISASLNSVVPSPDSLATTSAVFSADTVPSTVPSTVADCPVDAMVCVGPSPENSTTSSSYYGQSSTLSFLHSLQSAVFRGSTDTPRVCPTEQPTTATSTPPTASTLQLKSRFLPPRATADHLVNVYFSHVSDLYTILHEASFRREYEKLWQPEKPSSLSPDILWLCTMNCVLALACVFSDRLSLDDSKDMAQTLYGQARDLCPLDQIDQGGGVARVQALLLMGQYLQSTSEVNRCWNVFGMAIRVAQGMGLHLSEVNNRFPPLEQELRKRCWCGCLVMDSVLAMTFGRPMMIAPEYYEMDLPVEVDGEGDTSRQQPGLLLFTHKLKLYLVLQRILRTFYQTKDSGNCGSMAELDRQLHAWQAQLPDALRMDIDASPSPNTPSTSSSVSSSGRPRHILYARYLAVRIMLTRPSLAMVARSSSADMPGIPPLEQSFARSAAETCIATAKYLIDHIHTHLVMDTSTPLGASWYNTHSVFSASLVLFSAQTIPALRHLVVEGRHWDDGIEVMRLLARRFTPAQTCLSIMESFHRHLHQHLAQGPIHAQQTTNLAAQRYDEIGVGFLPSVPGYFSPMPPGDWFDFSSFSGFDDAFGQDSRW